MRDAARMLGPPRPAGTAVPDSPDGPMSPDTLALSYVQQLPEASRPLFLSEWNRRKKDRGASLGLSCLFIFGIAGVGRMYTGQIGLGIAMLLLSWLTCYIWPLVDIFLIGNAVDAYNSRLFAELQAVFPTGG